MTEERFITRPMSLWLDLARGLAALAVVLGHAYRVGIYTGPLTVFRTFDKDAVVVFFVLSGLVIATATDKRENSLASFVIARVSRIVPVTLAAVAVALAIGALDANLGAAPLFAEHRGWADPVEALQALLYLSESYNSEFPLNPPHWSLCYEVWFYALFAAATFATGRSRWLWLAALALAAGPNILLLLPTWLVGVWIARSPRALDVTPSKARIYLAVALASLTAMPLAAATVVELVRPFAPWDLGSALYAPTDFALAIGIGLGFIGLRRLSDEGLVIPAACEKPVRFLANCSFSMYLLHWPLMKLMLILGLGAGDSLAGFAAVVGAVVATSAAFATVTEHRRYAVRAFLERMFRTRPAALGASAGERAPRPS